MYPFDEENELKPLTREALEDFSNRCASLNIYKKDTPEYEEKWTELWCEAEEYQPMEGFVHIAQENGKEGVRNDFFNNWIVPPVFDRIVAGMNMNNNYIVKNGDKYGVVRADGKGTWVCPCKYDSAETLENHIDVIKVGINGKYGVVELCSGDWARERVEPVYDDIQETDGGYLVLKKDGKCGLYKYGTILPAEYERIFVPVIMGWIKVVKNGVWGYVDSDNEFTENIENAFWCNIANL